MKTFKLDALSPALLVGMVSTSLFQSTSVVLLITIAAFFLIAAAYILLLPGLEGEVGPSDGSPTNSAVRDSLDEEAVQETLKGIILRKSRHDQ